MLRHCTLALLLFALACTSSTSVTRTGTGLFAPKEDSVDDDANVPRGLSLSIASVARDGTATLELRNYSMESFVFSGTLDRPRLVIEVQSGNTQSRHTLSPLGSAKHEVPAGERVQLKTNIGGVSGRLRIGIRSAEFGYIVWSGWIAP